MKCNVSRKKTAMGAISICHLTSAHDRDDSRIFQKMCRSVQANGMKVTLVVADGKPNQVISGISVMGATKFLSRTLRMLVAPFSVMATARNVNSRIFHIHDPDLLVVGLILKIIFKACVIYDAHEDLPAAILAKTYIPERLRAFVSNLSNLVEKNIAMRLDAVIAATPHIKSKFDTYNTNCVSVCNYPIVGILPSPVVRGSGSENRIAYIGGLGVNRGIFELVRALDLCKNKVQLDLCGSFSENGFETSLKVQPGWQNVDFHGWVGGVEVQRVLSQSIAGIVVLKATPNYLHSLPIKMFEYMLAGVPVIGSNFPEWCMIIEKYECGILVDPESPKAIARAIDFIIDNPEIARRMGENGKNAVIHKFNWVSQEKKLIKLYKNLIKRAASPQ